MVSSDFGKLEVRRHLISGDDCAMAGEATAVAAAPAAETFKKSRRFIKASPCWGVFPYYWHCSGSTIFTSTEGVLAGRFRSSGELRIRTLAGLNMEARLRKRDKGMTALNESRMPLKRLRSRP